MKSIPLSTRALISTVVLSPFTLAIPQSLGQNSTLPDTTILVSISSQPTTASTNSSTKHVSSTARLLAHLEVVSNTTPGVATSPILPPLNTLSHTFPTATSLSLHSGDASSTNFAPVAPALAPAVKVPAGPVASTTDTTSYNNLPPNYLANAPPNTIPPGTSSAFNQNSRALSPIGLGTTGSNSQYPTAPSGSTQVWNANSSFAPQPPTIPLPGAGVLTNAGFDTAIVRPTQTPLHGAMNSVSTLITVATKPADNPVGVSGLHASVPVSLGTLPVGYSSSGVANPITPTLSTVPLSFPVAGAATPPVATTGMFTTMLLVDTQTRGVPSNPPATMIPSLPTPQTIKPVVVSFTAMPSMTNKPEATDSKAPAELSLPPTSLAATVSGIHIPAAEVASITSSILANPSLLHAVTDVKFGVETSTRVVDGHITHDVLGKASTYTTYVGTTDVRTTIVTATSISTALPFPLPTEIPEKNRASVDFGFSSGTPPGFYDRTIPMPPHSCPRDAITALARFRHFRRVTGMEAGWLAPSIDKCCGIYQCDDDGWHCSHYKRIGIAPKWEDYDNNNEQECRYWRTKDDHQYRFYMQNLHVFGLSDVDEKGWINEGPRKGQCCPEDGPPIDFGPHVAVKIIA